MALEPLVASLVGPRGEILRFPCPLAPGACHGRNRRHVPWCPVGCPLPVIPLHIHRRRPYSRYSPPFALERRWDVQYTHDQGKAQLPPDGFFSGMACPRPSAGRLRSTSNVYEGGPCSCASSSLRRPRCAMTHASPVSPAWFKTDWFCLGPQSSSKQASEPRRAPAAHRSLY